MRLPIRNEYPPDWKQISDATWAAAGHRCVRCGHPYRKTENGKGEWSPCDERCTHGGPLSFDPTGENTRLSLILNAGAMVRRGIDVTAQWRIGTVHHFDGDKANCVWWNLLALCQRCHLTIQARVNPDQPYMFEHSKWLKVYVAGFYAKKYEGLNLSRAEVELRLEELLSHELKTQ